MSISRHIRTRRWEEGQTAVEFALIAQLLIVPQLGITQFAIAFNQHHNNER